MIGMPELAEDARFRGSSALTDPHRREEFEAIFVPWLLDRTRAEATEAGQQAKVPCAPVAAPSDVLKDDHLLARDSFVSVERAPHGQVKVPGSPFRFSKGAWQARPAPTWASITPRFTTMCCSCPPKSYNRQRRWAIYDGSSASPAWDAGLGPYLGLGRPLRRHAAGGSWRRGDSGGKPSSVATLDEGTPSTSQPGLRQ